MLPSLGRLGRLALMLSLSLGIVAARGHMKMAWADGDDDDDGGDGGGDGGDTAGGDDGGSDEGGDEETPDKDQPLVTAGGLYTLKTYPTRENSRPLTMTAGILQLRAGIGTDLSAKGAFKSAGVNLEGIYGLKDNFELIGGLTDAYNFKQYGLYFGFEGSLAYDLIDIRVAANLHRNALPEYQNFCSPSSSDDKAIDPSDASLCHGAMAELQNLPDGTYHSGGTKFSIDLGFPFRYAIKPEIAIVALQTLMSIDFNAVDRDHTILGDLHNMDGSLRMDNMGNTLQGQVPTSNKVTPDFKPSIGIAVNPIPQLSLVINAQLIIPDFDTAAGAFQVPLTGRVEFSPSQRYDIGLEFSLLNVKPQDPQGPADNRYISLFAQARFGK